MNTAVKRLFASATHTLRECIDILEHSGEGIVLVVDDARRLLGTITDGDVRRTILAGLDMNATAQDVLARRPRGPYTSPVTAPLGTPDAKLLKMMNEYVLRHIPLVDETGRVVDVALLRKLVTEYELPLTAVVMAGGYGTRLRPLTDDLPKPMLPVGDRPLLEHILGQLRQVGIRRVSVTTHYKGEMIAEHFGRGQEFGIDIKYVKEDEPMGTAGALSLVEDSDQPLLIINGDILTKVDFAAMLDFHREHAADMTVAVKQHEIQVPFGVVETSGAVITGIKEKPTIQHYINAGIYLMNSDVRRSLSSGQAYDMPDLINRLASEGRKVVSFPIHEYWLDIGEYTDYERAQKDNRGEED